MDNNPIVVICTVIGTLVGCASLLLNFYQSGHGAQVGRGLIYSLGLLSLGFFLFAGYRWWDAGREDDRTAWQSAEKCGTAVCIRAYLEDHSNGHYAKLARALLQKLSPEPHTPESATPVVTERPAPSPRPSTTLIGGRYRDNNDGTVTDVQTGLQWMRCALGQTWNGGTCAGKAEEYQWQAALDAAESLNNQGGYAGYQDWRVPSLEELRGLVYCSSGFEIVDQETGVRNCKGDNYSRPTIDTTAFPQTPASYFWSASPSSGYSVIAWGVTFDYGVDGWLHRSNANHVRLVRAGQ